MKKVVCLLAVACAMMVSCTEKEDASTGSGYDQLVGSIDPNQDWAGTTEGFLTVDAAAEGYVSIYCEDVYDRVFLVKQYKVKSGSNPIRFDVPKRLDVDVPIYGFTPDQQVVVVGSNHRQIMVEYSVEGVPTTKPVSFTDVYAGARISFDTPQNMPSKDGAALRGVNTPSHIPSALIGRSTSSTYRYNVSRPTITNITYPAIMGYSTFDGGILGAFADALPENGGASGNGRAFCSQLVNNFEMISNGPFDVSIFYGVAGNSSNVVGYYYYDATVTNPTYRDLTYVTFNDVLMYDYYYDIHNYTHNSPIAKTQIQKGGQWYDVNYNCADFLDNNRGAGASRVGDQVWCIGDEYVRNGSAITAVRALTYRVNVPAGKKMGFFCTGVGTWSSSENHTYKRLNSHNNYLFTGVIRMYNGYCFIGMEDLWSPDEQNHDCNDVGLVLIPGENNPTIRLPYIMSKTEGVHEGKYYNYDGTFTSTPKADIRTDGTYTAPASGSANDTTGYAALAAASQSYIMGFEDRGIDGDYDLNDVVIKVTPFYAGIHQLVQVAVCAAGGTQDVDIYYRESDGHVIRLGEVHDLLGASRGTITNTHGSMNRPIQIVGYYDFTGKSMTANASDFYIVSDGNTYTVPTTEGETPMAICVSYDWLWPTERTCVSTAYPEFAAWSANRFVDLDWYTHPEANKVVNWLEW